MSHSNAGLADTGVAGIVHGESHFCLTPKTAAWLFEKLTDGTLVGSDVYCCPFMQTVDHRRSKGAWSILAMRVA